jgi:hypothetical protein
MRQHRPPAPTTGLLPVAASAPLPDVCHGDGRRQRHDSHSGEPTVAVTGHGPESIQLLQLRPQQAGIALRWRYAGGNVRRQPGGPLQDGACTTALQHLGHHCAVQRSRINRQVHGQPPPGS